MDVNIFEILTFKHGMLNALFAYIGILRLFMKPTMSLLLYISKITPSKIDDNLYIKINTSWWYNTIIYVIDWLTSLKIKK